VSYRIVFLERHFQEMRRLLFDRPGMEGAAFVLCGQARSPASLKLLSHAIVPVKSDEYETRGPYGLTIGSKTLTRVAKLARHEDLSVLFAHSHPNGIAHFSPQDDSEETKLIPFLQARVPNRVHGTVVLTNDSVVGRLFDEQRFAADAVLSVGERIRLWTDHSKHEEDLIHDRQVRAFGKTAQNVLRNLHVGIVGLGGTGSPVAQQLYRLGVGKLTLFDSDHLELSNLSRLYGSSSRQVGLSKVDVVKEALESIGLNTQVLAVADSINFEEPARRLRECDIVFGCTDKQIPRAILGQLSLAYNIPIFDLGVLIDSHGGVIRGVHGRVTTLIAGEACLFCRGRISPEVIRVEALPSTERRAQIEEGYAPELDEPAPAVIPFTTAIASAGVTELLQRLTGFMGSERKSSELLFAFDENRIRTNRIASREDCSCSDVSRWGRGDEQPFLGLIWPSRTR
jgi:molybdopterin/thiamine biosynthesis adenylyltransferase